MKKTIRIICYTLVGLLLSPLIVLSLCAWVLIAIPVSILALGSWAFDTDNELTYYQWFKRCFEAIS